MKVKNDASGNTIANMNPSFKGYLQYQDKDGNLKYVLRIVNGKTVRRYVCSTSGRIAIQSTNLKVMGWMQHCVEHWQEACERGPEGELINCGEPVFLGEDCYDWYVPDDPIDNGPTPPEDNGSGGNGGGSGGSGNGDSGNAQLTNNLQPGCTHDVADKLINTDVKGYIESMIHNIFGNWQDHANINFVNSAKTDGRPMKSDVVTWTVSGQRYISVTVNVNEDLLTGSSQEFRASLIIHEVIHGYLEYIGAGNILTQHAEIATEFADEVTSFLNSAYGLNTQSGYALALGGLTDYHNYCNTHLNQDGSNPWDDLLEHGGIEPTTEYPAAENNRKALYNQQLWGLPTPNTNNTGTVCP